MSCSKIHRQVYGKNFIRTQMHKDKCKTILSKSYNYEILKLNYLETLMIYKWCICSARFKICNFDF